MDQAQRLASWEVNKSSLQLMACKVVVKNIALFDNNNPNKRQRLNRLPNALRQEVLTQLVQQTCPSEGRGLFYFESIMTALPFLLTSATKEIRLDEIMAHCPVNLRAQYLPEVLGIIAANAPDVDNLRINITSPCGQKRDPLVVTEEMVDAICKMNKLRKLEVFIKYRLHFGSFVRICRTLRALEHVNVDLVLEPSWKSSLTIDEFKRLFGSLKTFRFCAVAENKFSRNHQRELTELCINHLQNLEVPRKNLLSKKSPGFVPLCQRIVV